MYLGLVSDNLGGMRPAVAVVFALLALAGCGPDEQVAPVRTVTVTQPAPAIAEDPACEGIRAQKAVNARLHADGYADDYSAEYDALLRAQNCR
jgi:hypothetical protein